MLKRVTIVLNAVIVAVLGFSTWSLLAPGPGATKAFCSGCFAVLGTVNTLYVLLRGGKRLFAVMMALGLALAMQADIAINSQFVKGASLFALAHLCYLVGDCLLVKPRWKDGLWALGLLVPAAAYLLCDPGLQFRPSSLRWVCVGYAVVISLMTGKAAANLYRQRSVVTGVLLAGSVLFFASDLLLVMDMFRGGGALFGTLCISLYYPAEALLAHGVFHAARR